MPADELAKAKNYVALGFPGEFETTGDLARKLEELVVYNLPDDTFTKFVSAVTSVTAADCKSWRHATSSRTRWPWSWSAIAK